MQGEKKLKCASYLSKCQISKLVLIFLWKKEKPCSDDIVHSLYCPFRVQEWNYTLELQIYFPFELYEGLADTLFATLEGHHSFNVRKAINPQQWLPGRHYERFLFVSVLCTNFKFKLICNSILIISCKKNLLEYFKRFLGLN